MKDEPMTKEEIDILSIELKAARKKNKALAEKLSSNSDLENGNRLYEIFDFIRHFKEPEGCSNNSSLD